ncbi:DUF2442 domain-containing protein [Nodosilinea sp. FACHB-131]|uniref:DUF2442 domain-containing protein n=1 Tax=Cyanophyceae TaxID=3028117 RepID=UPI0016825CD5|nr:DUF2442 domain-containing protein [Nodosilinea sp. FACHB-131]MBD1875583.1 DUF2442 domain-containing protein [Nodosilinea sp. FACHB-131]
MTSSMVEILNIPEIQQVSISADLLTVDLSDGRVIAVPLAWYPRLLHGTSAERDNWQLTGSQAGIHWPELDEDISLKNILLGQPSAESQTSLQRWLENRTPQARSSQHA